MTRGSYVIRLAAGGRARRAPSTRLVAVRSRSRTSRPIGCSRSWESTIVQPSSAACGKQRRLHDDRIEREVVERGDPARVRAPRPHREVPEERQRRRPGRPDDDRLVARRMPAGRDDRHARQAARARRRPSPPLPSRGRAGAPAGRSSPRAAGCRRARSPTRRAGRRSRPAERPGRRRPASRPPAWSKWRWLIATTSTVAGSNPAVSSAGTIHGPS